MEKQIIMKPEMKTLNRGPHVTTAGFVFDQSGRMLLMHRSDKVRSAKNSWSFPSGLHEECLTLHEQLACELDEELNLTCTGEFLQVGTYENIALGDGWHWVITMFVAEVTNLGSVVNKEPDKHDEIRLVDIVSFNPNDFTWAPGLHAFVLEHWEFVRQVMLLRIRYDVSFRDIKRLPVVC